MPATAKSKTDRPSSSAGWTFLTNHAHVLLCLVENPEARMRDVAARVAITERAVQRIVSELEDAGYLSRVRQGRANRYTVNEDLPLRHSIEDHCTIAELIKMVIEGRLRIGRPGTSTRVAGPHRSSPLR